MTAQSLTRADIMPMDAYRKIRRERRRALTEAKKHRRLSVGPDATFYFENYDTMWMQVHEMLFIEGGGEAQIDDELAAYNPLIPNGRELVATLMFEIADEDRRREFLAGLGGVEETVEIRIGDAVVRAQAETDVDRTSADALERVNDLLIHEYGHHYASDHLSSKYHDALTDLGAKLTRAALERRLRPGDFGYTLGGGR